MAIVAKSDHREKLRFLIVEDEGNVSQVFRLHLTLVLNYPEENVLECQDGDRAYVLVEEMVNEGHGPEIIISDLRIPGLDGIALFRKIQEMLPDYYRRVVKVLLTGVSMPEEVNSLREIVKPLGVYLRFKPIEIGELVREAENLLLSSIGREL